MFDKKVSWWLKLLNLMPTIFVVVITSGIIYIIYDINEFVFFSIGFTTCLIVNYVYRITNFLK